jgi:hypothetical protein
VGTGLHGLWCGPDWGSSRAEGAEDLGDLRALAGSFTSARPRSGCRREADSGRPGRLRKACEMEWRKANAERLKAYNGAWKRAHPEKKRAHDRRYREKKRGDPEYRERRRAQGRLYRGRKRPDSAYRTQPASRRSCDLERDDG